jgi:hypothetical protein
VVANINIYDFSRTLMMLKQLFVIWPIILVGSAVVIILIIQEGLIRKQSYPDHEKFDPFMLFGLCPYSLGALITAITVGKVGSDINYFLELMAVCSIWFSIGLKMIIDQNKPTRWLISGLIMIQLIWVLIGSIPITQTVITSRMENLPIYDSLFQQIKASTREGIVLSDDYLDMVVLSGQEIYYQPFEYGQLYQAGLWDPSDFSERINQQDFPLVVIGGDTINKACCWVPPLAEALTENYQMEILPEVIILTPNE